MASASAIIPVGYKQTEVGVIPEDWKVRKLGDICKFSTGSGLLKGEIKVSGKIPAIPYTALYTDFSEILDYELIKWFVDDISLTHVVSEPCVLIASSSNMELNTGKATALTEHLPVALGREIIILKTKYDAGYISYLLSSKLYRRRTLKLATGTTIKHLYTTTFHDYAIAVPSRSEQIAITGVLFGADALIILLKKLIDKKRAIKTSTMQELLTGKTRLPGFGGEWKVKSLAEIGEITGAGVDKKIVEGETSVRLVNYLDVYNRTFIYSNELKHHVTAPTSKATRCSVRKGDVFFTPTSEVRDDIAVSAIAMEDILDATYSYHVVRLRIDDDWDLNFRAYAFQTKAFLDQAAILSDGSGTRYVISLPNFRNIRISFPEKSEQHAIGQILSDMDAEITALEQRLEKTKAIKQGMMQQLLTGRIRLVEPSTPVEASA